MEFAEVLTTVQSRASYFGCSTDAVAGRDGWMSCADVIADSELLLGEIRATAVGMKSNDPQVLASLYVQSYSFRVPSVAIAAWALGLPSPSVAPESTLIRITHHRPGEVATLDTTITSCSAAMLVADVIDTHLDPLIAAVRSVTRIGARLLWSNVASSIATIFRAMQSSGDPMGDDQVRERAGAFFAAAPQLAELGTWSTIEEPGALGWYWDRSACCLWYQTASGSMCDDCSLHDDNERRQRRRTEVAAGITGGEAEP